MSRFLVVTVTQTPPPFPFQNPVSAPDLVTIYSRLPSSLWSELLRSLALLSQ